MLINQPSGPQFLYPTPVILYDLSNAEPMNQALSQMIKSRRDADVGLQRSNYGGWHSNVDMMAWAEQEARILLNAAISQISGQTADIHPMGKRDFSFDAQMWANVSGPGHSNQMHCHPGALWSGVYYVDNGESDPEVDVEGELLLLDPRFPMNTMYMPELVMRYADGKPQYSQTPYRPVNGRMILFPAWLKHSVRPYRGTRERISIAFNLMVEPDK